MFFLAFNRTTQRADVVVTCNNCVTVLPKTKKSSQGSASVVENTLYYTESVVSCAVRGTSLQRSSIKNVQTLFVTFCPMIQSFTSLNIIENYYRKLL